ncbi:phosphoketolase family protein [Candidatus Peregrinibacteria bacterium]|nr:phosphoketolase family protein [Candidatus Peregrinibacteria bacterium]
MANKIQNLKSKAVSWFEKYLRYVDYLAAAQLYLKDNFFLKKPLELGNIKDRILGHWGTVPGQNFIYAHCNYLIAKHQPSMLFISGPGHGAPAVFSNIFAEGTFGDFYEEFPRNAKGTAHLIKNFSWPGGLPSHVTPITPGSILEGGELGYSLATAYGAAFDNPDLIVACVVGDGEAETGPLAAAWHSNKFLNPAESGAVLPILHDNGYKISGPTIFGAMRDSEIMNFFSGLGYEPRIVKGSKLHEKMMDAMEWAYQTIRRIQKRARASAKSLLAPRWPVIILRSPKGWHGIKAADGKKIEGNFRSHGIPLGDVKSNPGHFKLLEAWLKSYRVEELVDKKGCPLPEVLEFVPQGNLRMGHNKHAFGGNARKPLKFPDLRKYEVLLKKKGEIEAMNTAVGANFIRDIFAENKDAKNFRFFCPDETDSNKMAALFQATGRAFQWPLKSYDEFMAVDGRVMEVLSEHNLQGWLQGYLLTGRHGMFATYEAFAMIVASMVDQYAKFIKQALKVAWRKPIASLNYLLTSLGWRQEHNGYSHQNPGFVSSVLEKHGEFASVYFPPDANSLLVTLEDCFKRKNAINVIVSGKNPMPQWLTLDEARKQLKVGVGVWEWVHLGSKNPDVVIASAGDHVTVEAMAAVSLLKKLLPKLNVRYVNVSELTSLGIGDERHPLRLTDRQFEKYFTADKPIIFNFHGYPDAIKKLVFGHKSAQRFSIHGYCEEGTTTTPFDMHVRNQTSRFHLVMDAIAHVSKFRSDVAKAAPKIFKQLQKKLTAHQKYILKNGKDMPDIESWK